MCVKVLNCAIALFSYVHIIQNIYGNILNNTYGLEFYHIRIYS